MNDLEICTRIAEIEGINVFMHDCIVRGGVLCRKDVVTGLAPQVYNPLTDKALCFDLMVKYELDVQAPYRPHNETEWEVMYWIDGVSDAGAVKNKNPQRAICLAIIAKYEAKND